MTAPKRPGRPVTQPCGTLAASRRHERRGEEPCEACRQAEREAQHRYYEARRARRRATVDSP